MSAEDGAGVGDAAATREERVILLNALEQSYLYGVVDDVLREVDRPTAPAQERLDRARAVVPRLGEVLVALVRRGLVEVSVGDVRIATDGELHEVLQDERSWVWRGPPPATRLVELAPTEDLVRLGQRMRESERTARDR